MTLGFLILMLASALGIVAFDQLAKLLVLKYLVPLRSVEVIPGLLDWTYVENRGAAFGMGQNLRWVFIVLTVCMIVACIYYLLRECKSKWVAVILTMIIGGGIGNLIDRLFRGFVVDFISVSFFPPVFNVADSFVVVGTILLIFILLIDTIKDFKKSPEPKAAEGEALKSEEKADDGRDNNV